METFIKTVMHNFTIWWQKSVSQTLLLLIYEYSYTLGRLVSPYENKVVLFMEMVSFMEMEYFIQRLESLANTSHPFPHHHHHCYDLQYPLSFQITRYPTCILQSSLFHHLCDSNILLTPHIHFLTIITTDMTSNITL